MTCGKELSAVQQNFRMKMACDKTKQAWPVSSAIFSDKMQVSKKNNTL